MSLIKKSHIEIFNIIYFIRYIYSVIYAPTDTGRHFEASTTHLFPYCGIYGLLGGFHNHSLYFTVLFSVLVKMATHTQ